MSRDQTPTKPSAESPTAKIEVHVHELAQLFNSMDPSPFRDKDLDDDAVEFIVGWAMELPTEKPLELIVHLDKPAIRPDAEAALQEAVHAFFRHRSEMTTLRLRQTLRTGRTSLGIGLVFLAACLLTGDWLSHLLDGNRFATVMRESLLIGGWVAMWRPLEIHLYDWWPIRNERRTFDRLCKMPGKIVCTGKQEPDPRPAAH
jgi:hypothetical protein